MAIPLVGGAQTAPSRKEILSYENFNLPNQNESVMSRVGPWMKTAGIQVHRYVGRGLDHV